KSNS
ncbi:putative rTX toxin, partial [Vibrio parahaemolyticus EKP-026]